MKATVAIATATILLLAPLSPSRAAEAAAVPVAPLASNTSGCGKDLAADLASGKTTRRTIDSGGRERTYLIHVSQTLDRSRAAPLVINLHGMRNFPDQQNAYSGFVPVSDREGFILVSPNGSGTWVPPPALTDIAFVREVLSSVVSELCIDQKRIYATGFSRGGFMATWFACAAPGLLAAIAPVSGFDAPASTCGNLPIMEFHGSKDWGVPFAGGTTYSGTQFAGAVPTMERWAQHNGCSGASDIEQINPRVRRVVYRQCKASTVQYLIEEASHTWPGAKDDALNFVVGDGSPPADLPATELIWRFFRDHSLQ